MQITFIRIRVLAITRGLVKKVDDKFQGKYKQKKKSNLMAKRKQC